MTRQLTELQNKFVELMLDDKVYTNEALATLLDCDIRYIYKMKQNPRVAEEIEKQADTTLKVSMGNAYGVLSEILFSPESSDQAKLKALQLYLQTQGKLKDKSDTEVNVQVNTAEKAEADLNRLLNL